MIEFVGLIVVVPIYIFAILVLGGAISAGLFIFHVAVVPLIFKYSKTFRRSLIFANFVQWPPFVNFDDPSSCGINGGRNFSIEYDSQVDKCPVKIGIWHILPKTAYARLKDDWSTMDKEELNSILDDELMQSTRPIIMYCHGNSNSRAATHRITLYKFFQDMDYHTIAFDYRGYGDSSNLSPTEAGVVEDSLVVYSWLVSLTARQHQPPAVFVWGHSLGTGISSHLLGNLDDLSSRLLGKSSLPAPNGLILEAPFSNLADEVAKHPLSKLVTWLPYYERTFVSPFRDSAEYTFRSDQHLRRVKTQPILILHAKDDVIVPFVVGLKLYRSIVSSRGAGDAAVTLHAYDSNLGLGHKWICNAPDLREVIGEFVNSNL